MTESDASLVARIRSGETDAVSVLLGRHSRAAYLVAMAHVGNETDAEDVLQDAFIKSLERLSDCRDPARFGRWLIRIVRNTAHNRREYLVVRSGEPLSSHSQIQSIERADYAAQQHELLQRLREALAQLSASAREVVLLHDLEGWPHSDIAARLGMSVMMSRRVLSDSRKRLRAILGDYAALEPDHD